MKTAKIGDIVHYIDEHGVHNAAIVTEVHNEYQEGAVCLTVFSAALDKQSIARAQRYPGEPPYIPHDEIKSGRRTWHWPEHE